MNRIHVFPNWGDNPYLNMLYVGARSEGWIVDGSTRLDPVLAALATLGTGDVFHIHWTSPIFLNATRESEGRTALSRFRAGVDSARGRGARVLWTVHNKITHDAQFVELEVELAEYLSDIADRIIQLHPFTRDAVADLYDLPLDKLVTLRHASYVGMYAEPPTKEAARAHLGVPYSSPTIGFVGQIRAYKGLTTLLRAVGSVAAAVPDVTLLLAGKTDPAESERIERDLPADVRAIRQQQFVAHDQIGTWFAAADVMVFPYEKILNSGSMLLSATFKRPCILPAEPHLVAAFGDEPWISFFEPTANPVRSLADAIEAALADATSPRRAAGDFAAGYTTLDMSRDFLQILADLDDSTGASEGDR